MVGLSLALENKLWQLEGGVMIHNQYGTLSRGADIEVFGNRWKLGGLLGDGGFGTVIRAVAEDGRRMVMKFLSHSSNVEQIDESMAHRRAYGDSELVVNYSVDCIEKDIVGTEYIEGDDAYRQVTDMNPTLNRGDISLENFLNAIMALRYSFAAVLEMEQRGFYHRDLKPHNLIMENVAANSADFPGVPEDVLAKMQCGRARLIDLDCFISADALVIEQAEEGLHLRGTPRYMAPEQFSKQIRPGTERFGAGRICGDMIMGDGVELNGKGFGALSKSVREGRIYSADQMIYLDRMRTMDSLAPVEKAARNLPQVLRSLLKPEPLRRLPNTQTASGLMSEIFTGGNLLTL